MDGKEYSIPVIPPALTQIRAKEDDFCLHVDELATTSRVVADQPALPGLTPRGRPRSGLTKVERVRRCQAKRRQSSVNKSLSVEVDGVLLKAFKACASGRLPMRKAVEEAMRNWISSSSTATDDKAPANHEGS